MYHMPGIEELHALRDSLGVIVRAKLPIGPDGRNRPSLFPFCTATGRNAHAQSLYNAHAGMRGLHGLSRRARSAFISTGGRKKSASPPLSPATRAADGTTIASGDVYHALAIMCGLTNDPDSSIGKQQHGDAGSA